MTQTRRSGILMHPTSLYSTFGIGDLGPSAYEFANFVRRAGQTVWEILPLGPTGWGNSPYQGRSAYAGNPLLISPELLVKDGLLNPSDLELDCTFPDHRVDYEAASRLKKRLLRQAHASFVTNAPTALARSFRAFVRKQAWWLDDYALFEALTEAHDRQPWYTWDRRIARREAAAMAEWTARLADRVGYFRLEQFLFSRQWLALKDYCSAHGILIMGDMPIFVAHDSADVWAQPDQFRLDRDGLPTVVAGVPPDYFSEDGQLWGNPIYDWNAMARDGYRWWIRRFRAAFEVADIVRIDHFRGFEAFWETPASEETARGGRWVKGPGAALFLAVRRALGRLPIIAENLGEITEEVEEMRVKLGFPGMAVLQFAFGVEPVERSFRPHNFARNLVAYTGTHDNNTILGWWESDIAKNTRSGRHALQVRRMLRDYLGYSARSINWALIRLLLASPADTVVFPIQDVLGLSAEARMNTPGTVDGNWEWQCPPDALSGKVADRLRALTRLYDR